MTEENLKLRERLKNIESTINAALGSQPEDDDECQIHLKRTLESVVEKTGVSDAAEIRKAVRRLDDAIWTDPEGNVNIDMGEDAIHKILRTALAGRTLTGKWLNGHDYEYEFAYCSECGHMQYAGWETHGQAKEEIGKFYESYRYCPGCGAKMTGGAYVEYPTGGAERCNRDAGEHP